MSLYCFMNFLRKIKNTATSAFIASGKVQEKINEAVNTEYGYIQEMRKEHINLLSKKKFYELLNEADEYTSNRFYSERGLQRDPYNRSFINKIYTKDSFKLNDPNNYTYHLKTDNNLGKYAKHVNLITEDNQHVLEFIVNPHTSPESRYDDLTTLSSLIVNENGKTFEFSTIKYLGSNVNPNGEISIFYQVNINQFGEYNFELDDTPRILTKKDCPPHNTYYL